MTRLGWFESLVLVAFFAGGLAAFLIWGLWAAGHVIQGFLVLSAWWIVRELYREYSAIVLENIQREQAFNEWSRRQQPRLRGME